MDKKLLAFMDKKLLESVKMVSEKMHQKCDI